MKRSLIKMPKKREEILEAAMKLFFARGYDGTSIRMIQREVGSEPGLFYYYFKSKDEIWDKVIERYFAEYVTGLDKTIADGQLEPLTLLSNFFQYVKEAAAEFRRKYADNMHRSMQWAIRERTLSLLEPYVEKILVILADRRIKSPVDNKVAAMFLTHGVGSIILHEKSEFFDEKKKRLTNVSISLWALKRTATASCSCNLGGERGR